MLTEEQKARRRELEKIRYYENPQKVQDKNRKRRPQQLIYAREKKYGVTQEWVDDRLKEQNGKCAICFSVLEKPCVDHNHETNQPRGLLCSSCNVFLGLAREDTQVLVNAIEYLRKYK